jgi:diaminopimelate decarboxylase
VTSSDPSLLVRPSAFRYRLVKGHFDLSCGEASLTRLAARFGTPLYVYSASMFQERLRTFDDAFQDAPHTVCYSVKANSTLGILRLAAKSASGFDVVSGGELERVRKASPLAVRRTVFSGVGKTAPEITNALKAGIMLFNVESASELNVLARTAERLKKTAPVALRVNPDVPTETHPYISTGLHEHKFGIPISQARDLYARAARSKHLKAVGVSVHIGSQITDVAPFQAAMERVAALVRELRIDGHAIRYIDAGGGYGVPYRPSHSYDFAADIGKYARAILAPLSGLDIHLLLEPGRSIVAPTGVLVTRIVYRKTNGRKRFLIVDAAMNDLLRPSLYKAYHEIVPVTAEPSAVRETTDVVGPVCETGDFFARDRELPVVDEGGLLAILDAGAYGMSLASNYNTRPRPAEVLVEGKRARLIRKRESFRDLVRSER